MAGLSLRAGLGAGMGAQTNGGLTPYPAQTPTGPRASTAAAWGVAGAGNGGARTAMVGGVAVSVAAGVLLVFLWYSLPR